MLECLALEILHGDEASAVMLANFIDGANVWMIQSRSSASFTAKSFERLRVFCEVFGQKLEGNEAAQLQILRLVDDTHAPATEFFEDAVVRDGLANHGQRLAES